MTMSKLGPRRGLLLVISSPSGAGKSSLSRRLIAEHPRLELSVSCTTRAPRPGETDGVEYHFVTPERFAELVAEDGGDEADLEDGGHDVEDDGGEKVAHALVAAVQRPRERAGLLGQVERQVQVVQVQEDVVGHDADGTLRYGREDGVTELAKRRRPDARHAI